MTGLGHQVDIPGTSDHVERKIITGKVPLWLYNFLKFPNISSQSQVPDLALYFFKLDDVIQNGHYTT